jgi:hypothetical protein
VRIRSCDLTAGDGHLGIRVIDAQRAEIEDNTLQVVAEARDFRRKLADERVAGPRPTYGRYVDGVNKFFMHRTFVRQDTGQKLPWPPPPETVSGLYPRRARDRLRDRGISENELDQLLPFIEREQITFTWGPENRPWRVTFETPQALVKSWQRLLSGNPLPQGVRLSLASLKDRLGALSDQIITEYLDNRLALPEFGEALALLADEKRAVGAMGVVVAGSVFGETRILNNTVSGFAIGIHVGHSHQRQTRRAARTLIVGNTVRVRINGEHWHDRHGIFSGNSENTSIESNSVTADLSPLALAVPLEGIRVYGIFGPMLMVRANQTIDCQVGIRAHAVNPGSYSASVWRVHDNAVRGTTTPFAISPPMP